MDTQKRNYAILGFAGVASLVALILGIVAIVKKVLMGMVSVFDSGWSEAKNVMADSIVSHKNAVIGLGLVGLVAGAILFVGVAFAAWKQFKGSEVKIQIIIWIVVLSVVALVLASIAMAFNANLNDAVWMAKQQIVARSMHMQQP